jgi:hypothetical protein
VRERERERDRETEREKVRKRVSEWKKDYQQFFLLLQAIESTGDR